MLEKFKKYIRNNNSLEFSWYDKLKDSTFSNQLKFIQANKKNINTFDQNGEILLIVALKHWTYLIKPILNLGADINLKNKAGDTVLLHSLIIKTPGLTFLDINETDNTDHLIKEGLSLSKLEKRIILMDGLIKAGANVNSQNDNGYTLIMMAMAYGLEKDSLIAFLKYNPDLNLKNKNGQTTLDAAREHKFDEFYNILLIHQEKTDLTATQDNAVVKKPKLL